MFTVSLCVSGIASNELLAVPTSSLVKLGAKDPYLMRNEYQVWRFFTPMFLHVSLNHLLSNLITTLIIAPAIEESIGAIKFLTLYILSGIGGILFSALCTEDISCGASTAIYGLIGSYISFLIVNWVYFRDHPEKKC